MTPPEVAFPPLTYEQWREKVEQDLRGGDVDRTLSYGNLDGLPLQVLEHESTAPTGGDPAGFPGSAPYTRGTATPRRRGLAEGWVAGLEIDGSGLSGAGPDGAGPEEVRAHLLHDLGLGAGVFWLRNMVGDLAALERLFDGIDLSILQVLFDAGDPLRGAAALAEVAARIGVEPAQLHGSLCGDPIGELALSGGGDVAAGFDDLASAARWCREQAPGLRAGHLSARSWHEAGATPVQELGFTLAAAATTLRELEAREIPPHLAAPQLLSVFNVGRETFLEIAKLRAWRLIYSKLLRTAGAGDEASHQRLAILPATIHLTRVDPWVNLLRATNQTFVAATAGADLVITPRYDQLFGPGGGEMQGRRTSIHVQHVLAQEAYLGRVADPAGGSWAIERMTDELARAGWELFRAIEGEGGLIAALEAGTVQSRIAAKVHEREKRLRKRLDPIIGVSFYPLVGEERPANTAPRAEGEDEAATATGSGDEASSLAERSVEGLRRELRGGARVSDLGHRGRSGGARFEKLKPFHSAALFEDLRLAIDDAVEAGAPRPSILLVGLGSPAESRARREFAAGIFSVAGFATPAEEGFGAGRDLVEWASAGPGNAESSGGLHGVRFAVLCSSDARYEELAADAASTLRAAGIERIYLAGRPGKFEESWRQAGVSDFIYLGCDVVSLLESLATAEAENR